MKKLEEHLQGNRHPEAMVHSDQGFHYTHPGYQRLVGNLGLIQSMSRRGKCLDNAPIESFFGHLKDYVTNRSCGSIEEVREIVGDYISYYNCERGQWNLKKDDPETISGPSDRSIENLVFLLNCPFYGAQFSSMQLV